MVTKVFLSSTSRDLEAYRKLACEVCLRLGMLPLPMEYFEAMGVGATAGSRRKLDEADLYVGIFAHRYGHVEPSEGRSVTECEFEHAGTRGLDRLCFLAEPGHAVEHRPQNRALRARQHAFRGRVEARLIRALFTSPEDFGLKLTQALTAWQRGDAQARLPQPRLESRVVGATSPAERWSFRARAVPVVGRQYETADLLGWCNTGPPVSWQVLAGPAGCGKSRLAQELCLALPQGWHAGFVAPDQMFDWSGWQPNAATLLVLDYAGEYPGLGRTILGALARSQNADRPPVRLLLLEREADGPWLQAMLGSRSDAVQFRQIRASPKAIVLGPFSQDTVWELTKAAVGSDDTRMPPRAVWLAYVDRLDRRRTPLLLSLAIEHWRRIGATPNAGRADLLAAWLARERTGWRARGALEPYENLLALATACGGLPDSVLAQPADPTWLLPPDLDFDPSVYTAMGVGEWSSERLAPLRPDLLGEWFVLETLRGRNPRLSEQRARVLARLAWSNCGGETRRPLASGVVAGAWWVTPSPWWHFLRRCIEDFPDHDNLEMLLSEPPPEADGREWWLRLIYLAVERLGTLGRVETARRLLVQLEQAQGLAETDDWVLRARIVMAAALFRAGQAEAAATLMAEASATQEADPHRDMHAAPAAEAALATLDLAAQAPLATALLAMLALAAQRSPSPDSLPAYARALAQWVMDKSLDDESRRAQFRALQELCTAHIERDVTPVVSLADAAHALCDHYLDQDCGLDEAMHMSAIVRGVLRQRERWRVVDPDDSGGPFAVRVQVDDLRRIRLDLARCAIGLIPALARANRHSEALERLREIQVLSQPYGWDAEFSRCWVAAVALHAQEMATQGEPSQVPKAIDAIVSLSARFPDDAGAFIEMATDLGQGQVRQAAEAGDTARCLLLFERIAQANAVAGAGPASELHLALAAAATLFSAGLRLTLADQKRVVAAAAAALRSDRYREHLGRQGVGESVLAKREIFLAEIEAARYPAESGPAK